MHQITCIAKYANRESRLSCQDCVYIEFDLVLLFLAHSLVVTLALKNLCLASLNEMVLTRIERICASYFTVAAMRTEAEVINKFRGRVPSLLQITPSINTTPIHRLICQILPL